MDLTEEQQRVVEAGSHLYVRACPGAGKTRTIVALAASCLGRERSRRGAAFLSFTNAACDELRDRLAAAGLDALGRTPSYVGTFDSFLLRFVIGPDGTKWARGKRPIFLEKWKGTIGFRPPGAEQPIGVPLEAFVPNGAGGLDLELSRIDSWPVRKQVEGLDARAKEALLERGTKQLLALLKEGYVTAPFLRRDATRVLKQGGPQLSYLGARFALVVVDEGQDCNPSDLELIAVLKAGSRCVVVGDPEQSIYRWRDADPNSLAHLGLAEMRLTGNFRSSSNICAAAASLRSVDGPVDRAVGPHASVAIPVAVIPYDAADTFAVGAAFSRLITETGIETSASVVLSHQVRTGLAAYGISDEPVARASAASTLARWLQAREVDPSTRRAAIELIEGVLTKALGSSATKPSLARWIRYTARQVLGKLREEGPGLGSVCSSTRGVLATVSAPSGEQFEVPPHRCFQAKDRELNVVNRPRPPVRISTVHAAKGREYDAVLFMMRDDKRLTELLKAWEARDANYEARAVAYVAATRARRLLAFGVPNDAAPKVAELLGRHGAAVAVIEAPTAWSSEYSSTADHPGAIPRHELKTSVRRAKGLRIRPEAATE